MNVRLAQTLVTVLLLQLPAVFAFADHSLLGDTTNATSTLAPVEDWVGGYSDPGFYSPDADCGICGPTPGETVPFATLIVDALWLNRSLADSQDILFDGLGEPILNVTDVDLDAEAGARVELVLYHELGYDLQMGYFGINEYRTLEQRTAPGATYLFFGGSPLAPIDTYTVEYTSKMSNGELNARWRVHHHWALLAGPRITDLQEVFNVLTGPMTGVFSDIDNDLYGFQIGGQGVLWTNGYARFESTLKGGIFHNNADVYAEATDGVGSPLTLTAASDEVAFLGEVIAGFVIPIWPGELRFGYHGLYIQNVVLAPDQSDSLSFFAPGTVDFGDVMYHGGYVGWQATW